MSYRNFRVQHPFQIERGNEHENYIKKYTCAREIERERGEAIRDGRT